MEDLIEKTATSIISSRRKVNPRGNFFTSSYYFVENIMSFNTLCFDEEICNFLKESLDRRRYFWQSVSSNILEKERQFDESYRQFKNELNER